MTQYETDQIYFRGGAQLDFPLSVFDTWIAFREVEIHQDVHEHDLAVIRARSRFLKWKETLYPGTPVRIEYSGRGMPASVFHGYVTHVKPVSKLIGGQYDIEIYCVSASRDLRKTGQNVWRNRTAPEIVSQIAKQFGLRVITKQHPYRKPQTIQSGETYWEFLTRLAKSVGYGLRVEKGYLIFLPFDDLVEAYVTRAPRLTNIDTMYPNGEYVTRNVVSMHMWGGDTDTSIDRLSDDAIVTSLSPNGGGATPSRRGPRSAVRRDRRNSKYAKFRTDVVAHTRKDAEVLAESAAAAGSMSIDAQGVVAGDGYLSPYRPVYLKLRDETMNEWWIVKSVVHKIDMTNGTYMCDVTLSTDSIERSRLPSNAQNGFRNLSEESRQGWSPSLLREPRLRITKPGFVRAQTKYNKTSARWVGF